MRIAIYSLTRDRLDYSKVCFAALHEKAGYPFDHFIVDNGSEDGTVAWLFDHYKPKAKHITLLEENVGISKASNIALSRIHNTGGYDLICKMDNDCLVQSVNILKQVVEIYQDAPFKAQYILSPRVEGITNQPTRGRLTQLGGRRIGLTAIVGGLFHCVPAEVYKKYYYPETLPMAKGQDDHFCAWAKQNGAEVGYIEGLVVEHHETTEGQAKRYPSYFTRKYQEELLVP